MAADDATEIGPSDLPPCKCASHYAREYVNVVLPETPDTVYRTLFHDNETFGEFLRQLGDSGMLSTRAARCVMPV